MSDIEEDVKILNNLKRYLNILIYEGQHKIFYNDLGYDEKTIDCINALEHILAERKQDKARIQELEAKLEFKQWGDLDNIDFEEYMKNFISKEKVKESYLKMEKEYARKVYDDNYNRNEVKKEEFYKRQVYEELLGESK